MANCTLAVMRHCARVVEWQTRRTQNPLLARGCGFKSHLGHHVDQRKRPGIRKMPGRHDHEVSATMRVAGGSLLVGAAPMNTIQARIALATSIATSSTNGATGPDQSGPRKYSSLPSVPTA